jgi:hypothetical protein
MTRQLRSNEREKKSKARRENALARLDLREPSSPRESAVSPTSHAIKQRDPGTQAAIEAFLAKQGASHGERT